MHELVAERIARQSRRRDWREARDLGLLVTVTTVGPLAVFAAGVGASHTLVGGLVAVTGLAAFGLIHVFRREYGIDLTAGSAFAGVSSRRWASATLRLIPIRHRPSPARGPRALTKRRPD